MTRFIQLGPYLLAKGGLGAGKIMVSQNDHTGGLFGGM